MQKLLMVFFLSSGLVFVLGCASSPGGNTIAEDREKVDATLQPEISLKADRDKLAELRAEIPKDKQQSNDELALFLGLMNNNNEVPGAIREKFQTLVMRKRETFRNKVTRLREDFKDEEVKKREAFMNELKDKRTEFVSSKHDAKASRDFFAEQDKLRRNYFADERDRRKSFESEVLTQQKDFEFYMKERMATFNEQHKIYSKAFYDRANDKKQAERKAVESKAEAKKAEQKSYSDEFEDMNKVDSSPLSTDN